MTFVSSNDYGALKSEEDVTNEILEKETMSVSEETIEEAPNDNIPLEPFKTLVSGLFLCSGLLATSISLAMTHDHVPVNTSSLPDFVLDHVTFQYWGLDASEIVLMINVLIAFIVVICHKYRVIVLRCEWNLRLFLVLL